MRQTAKNTIIWILDVIVAVFIGPVRRDDDRGTTGKGTEEQRKKYAFALGGFTLIAIVLYTVINRWSNSTV
ncbi:hypothetical protein [Paenibacillus alkalitolerans]|uniref:hypothetical protein n=1 Tax=Paenibacillus alkalitolerans TaxID=2799335 RepID=UPI0018F523CF|nr:hypothetical protein [Paenibacillus alkalitolerans]